MTISPRALFDFAACESRGLDLFLMLLAALVSYLVYWFVIESPKLKERFAGRWGAEGGSLRFFIFNKSWGALWFGLVCTAAAVRLFPSMDLADMGFAFPTGSAARATLFWNLALLPLLVLAAWAGNRKKARSGKGFGRYPEIGASLWGPETFAVHAGFWILYLIAYELLFRGTLLFPLAAAFGPWPAIGINLALYSAVHIPKGAAEAIGALVLGLLLCIITLQTGSILTAVLAHCALALTNGISAFAFRSDMSLRRPGGGKESEA